MKFEDLRLDRIQTILHFTPKQASWCAKARHCHIIGVNLSGTSHHDLGYKNMTIDPDCIYFFNQKDDYNALVDVPGLCYSVHFTTTEPIETDSFCKSIRDSDKIVKMITRVERHWLQRGKNELQLLADFYALCATLYDLHTQPYLPTDTRILAAKEYMDLHFKEKHCLKNAVRESGLTQRRFCDLFKHHFGTTPNRFITVKQIEHAKELLALGYLSVSQVAELVGFSDVYYFSKAFKKEVGLAPRQYKSTV